MKRPMPLSKRSLRAIGSFRHSELSIYTLFSTYLSMSNILDGWCMVWYGGSFVYYVFYTFFLSIVWPPRSSVSKNFSNMSVIISRPK